MNKRDELKKKAQNYTQQLSDMIREQTNWDVNNIKDTLYIATNDNDTFAKVSFQLWGNATRYWRTPKAVYATVSPFGHYHNKVYREAKSRGGTIYLQQIVDDLQADLASHIVNVQKSRLSDANVRKAQEAINNAPRYYTFYPHPTDHYGKPGFTVRLDLPIEALIEIGEVVDKYRRT